MVVKWFFGKIIFFLLEKNLIKFRINPTDRRERFIFFTESGKKIYLEEKKNSMAIASYAAKQLGQEDTRQVIRLFDRISDIFCKGDFKNER